MSYGRKITGNTGRLSQAGGYPCIVDTKDGPMEAILFEYGDPAERDLHTDSRDRSHLACVYYVHRPWVGWVLRSRVRVPDGET